MDETQTAVAFMLGFPLFFAALWLAITRLLSWIGWSRFVPAFRWDRDIPADTRCFPRISMMIGNFPRRVVYRKTVTVCFGSRGIYLRPALLFRLFHPALHFGWDAVDDIAAYKRLWSRMYRLDFRRDVPPLFFEGAVGQALFEQWHSRSEGKRA